MKSTLFGFKYNDGGRAAAGYRSKGGDCVCRSIAIATGLPYQKVYDRLAEGNATQRKSIHHTPSRSVKGGVSTYAAWFKRYMKELGFVWYTAPTIKLDGGKVPMGRIICSLHEHVVAIIDGVMNDDKIHTKKGYRRVYGYWKLK